MPPHAIPDADLLAIESWVDTVSSAITKRAYRRYATSFLSSARKPLAEVTEDDVRDFLARLEESTPASYRPAAGAVKAFLRRAHKHGLVAGDLEAAISTVRPLKPVTRRMLTQREIAAMILLESDERNAAMLLLAYSMGLQISELAALTWSDIVDEGNGRPFLALPDRRGAMRRLAVPPTTWEALRSLRGHARPEHPVFVSKKGGHLDPSAIHRVVKAAAARAGLPDDTSSYWLRHSHAAHRINEGVSIDVMQVAMGHADRRSTTRYAPPVFPGAKPAQTEQAQPLRGHCIQQES